MLQRGRTCAAMVPCSIESAALLWKPRLFCLLYIYKVLFYLLFDSSCFLPTSKRTNTNVHPEYVRCSHKSTRDVWRKPWSAPWARSNMTKSNVIHLWSSGCIIHIYDKFNFQVCFHYLMMILCAVWITRSHFASLGVWWICKIL